MGSSKGPSQAELEEAEREKARLAELRRQADLARLSRGRAQRNLGVETQGKPLGPFSKGQAQGRQVAGGNVLESLNLGGRG